MRYKVTVRLEQIIELELEADNPGDAQTKALRLARDEGEGQMVGESANATSVATVE